MGGGCDCCKRLESGREEAAAYRSLLVLGSSGLGASLCCPLAKRLEGMKEENPLDGKMAL